MQKFKLLMLSTLLMLSACASTTPIAVRTPQWQVPPVAQEIKAQEIKAQAKAKTSLESWDQLVSRLPTPSATPAQP